MHQLKKKTLRANQYYRWLIFPYLMIYHYPEFHFNSVDTISACNETESRPLAASIRIMSFGNNPLRWTNFNSIRTKIIIVSHIDTLNERIYSNKSWMQTILMNSLEFLQISPILRFEILCTEILSFWNYFDRNRKFLYRE